MWVSDNIEFYTRIPSEYEGCTGPLASDVTLQRNPSSPTTGFGSTLVAFDEGTMEGAFIRDTDYSLRLNRPLLQGGSSFLMDIWKGTDTSPARWMRARPPFKSWTPIITTRSIPFRRRIASTAPEGPGGTEKAGF